MEEDIRRLNLRFEAMQEDRNKYKNELEIQVKKYSKLI